MMLGIHCEAGKLILGGEHFEKILHAGRVPEVLGY